MKRRENCAKDAFMFFYNPINSQVTQQRNFLCLKAKRYDMRNRFEGQKCVYVSVQSWVF